MVVDSHGVEYALPTSSADDACMLCKTCGGIVRLHRMEDTTWEMLGTCCDKPIVELIVHNPHRCGVITDIRLE